MSTYDLKKYKESKILLPQLEMVLTIVKLTEKGLVPFNYFISVAKILNVLREQLVILECHRNDLKKIKNTKGLK